MPVADTEFLFALNPKDSKHQYAIRLLKEASDLGCLTPLPSSFKWFLELVAEIHLR